MIECESNNRKYTNRNIQISNKYANFIGNNEQANINSNSNTNTLNSANQTLTSFHSNTISSRLNNLLTPNNKKDLLSINSITPTNNDKDKEKMKIDKSNKDKVDINQVNNSNINFQIRAKLKNDFNTMRYLVNIHLYNNKILKTTNMKLNTRNTNNEPYYIPDRNNIKSNNNVTNISNVSKNNKIKITRKSNK